MLKFVYYYSLPEGLASAIRNPRWFIASGLGYILDAEEQENL